MKGVIFAVLLLILVSSQEIIQQELPEGVYTSFFKQDKAVPRYYICGMDVARREEWHQPSQNCYQMCKRRGFFRRKKCWHHCDPIPPRVLQWNRINGIFVRYCHFQIWDNQFQLSSHGDWARVGYKMCPKDQHLNGFSIKKSGRDGISGLRFNCKGMYNSNANSVHFLFDGEG